MRQDNFFRRKSIGGFYIPALSVVISVVVAVIYQIGFTGTTYLSPLVTVLTLAASVLFIVLSFFEKTQKFASPVAWVLQFLAFLSFISVSYMYLTEAFYAGVSVEAISNMNPAWPVTMIGLLINVILCNIGIYKKQERGN